MYLSRSTEKSVLPRRILTGLGALTLAVAGCGDPTAPLPREGAPDELTVSIAGYFGGFSTWELRGDTLVYRTGLGDFRDPVQEVRTVPSAEAWRAFWIESERVGLRHWRREYIAEGIVDGAAWRTRVKAGNALVESGGYNAYPDESGREHEGTRTAAFEAYLSALRQLVGME